MSKRDTAKQLKSYAKMTNLVTEAKLDKETIDKISSRVLFGFKEDLSSCQEWLRDVKAVEELASLAAEPKNYPLPNSANVKFPLIAQAIYQFTSTTYPELFKDGKLVKTRVIGLNLSGEDTEKAKRVAEYMNYQLLMEDDEWEKDADILLTKLGLVGFLCKKTYYEPIKQKIKSILCNPEDLIINSSVKNLNDARRISHIIKVHLNDLIEGANYNVYTPEVVDEIVTEHEEDQCEPTIELVEQHTFLDLDDDSYTEPYIVTFEKLSGRILRIAPRFTKDNIKVKSGKFQCVEPLQFFTDYHFLVSPKGKFQSVGFGILLLHLNESINSILNQLIDAGSLANTQGGYKDSRLKNMGSGQSLHRPGEWISVKSTAGVSIKEGIVPITYKEPSSVLFQLLGLLIQVGKDLSSSNPVTTGAVDASNAKTGAVAALMQAGQKVTSSILKRIYRSLTMEFKKLFVLNSLYLEPKVYYDIVEDRNAISRSDFDTSSVSVIPCADPNLSSIAQRAERNQILIAAQQLPGTNKIKLTELILENSDLSVPVKDIMMDEKEMQKPDPALIELQAKIKDMGEKNALKGHELMIEEQRLGLEKEKQETQNVLIKAQSMLAIAQAEAQKEGSQFKELQMQLDILAQHMAEVREAAKFKQANQIHQNEIELQRQQMNQEVTNDTGQTDPGVAA